MNASKILIVVFAIVAAACGNTATQGKPLTTEAARFEAQKILSALKGRAGSAAFMDAVLKRDDAYGEIFTHGLKPLIDAAPVADPAFAPYASCVAAGRALLKFSELRRLGSGQNAQSDEYRRPYWDNLILCEKAVG